MSEQNQSNFQAFGAGLLGFVAVMAIGGGALMVRSSQQAKAGPEAAGAPIDLGSSMSRPSLSPISAQKERRAQSPAPLTGEVSEPEGSEAPAAESAGAAVSSPESATKAQSSASHLEVTQHLDKPGNGSSATAIVNNELAPESAPKAADKKALGKKSASKIAPAGGGAVASVHYGVTNRSELMGRAAGPVYNVKGGSGKAGTGATGKMAAEVNAKISEIQKQLEAPGLTPEKRDKLEKDLEDVIKGVVGPAMTAEAAKAAQ